MIFLHTQRVRSIKSFLVLASNFHGSLQRRGWLDRKGAQSTKSGAVEIKQPDSDNANNAQPTKKTDTFGNTQVAKERVCKQDTPTRQRTAEEIIRSEEAGSVHGVAEWNVDEYALHDDEYGGAVDGDPDCGRDPVDRGASCPGEEEETDGGTNRGWESRDQALFLHGESEARDARIHPEVEVGGVRGDAENAGYQDTEKDQTNLAEVHVVIDWVDEREHLEERVVDTVDDCGVDLNEEHRWILEGDFDRLDQSINGNVRDTHIALINLRLGHEAALPVNPSKTLCAPEKDGSGAGLGEEEEHD